MFYAQAMLAMIAGAALAAGPTSVVPFCVLTTENVVFHVEIVTRWRGEDGGTNESADLYSVKCDVKKRTCDGASVRLGKPALGFFDVNSMGGIILRSVVGGIAVLSWGVHQFVFDKAAGTVTKSATQRSGTAERGVGYCSPQ